MTNSVWWKFGVIYQIYPRSFRDTNDDGIGDLKGITERLDYFSWLGIDAIWISPIFPSPMVDFGYDVSDYCSIDPLFGSLNDFDRLIAAAHAREIKIILDFVPNHSSDQHPWFLESRAVARQSAKRLVHLARPGKLDGIPPNNWLRDFGGPAGTLMLPTGQFYPPFLREQPDLNWRNPAVRTAIYDVLRFWLHRGVDGFRVDAPLAVDERRASFATILRTRPGGRTRPASHRLLQLFRRPVGNPRRGAEMRTVLDRLRGPRSDRRDLSAGRTAGHLLRDRI